MTNPVFGARRVTATVDLVVEGDVPDSKLQDWLRSMAAALQDDAGRVAKVDNVRLTAADVDQASGGQVDEQGRVRDQNRGDVVDTSGAGA